MAWTTPRTYTGGELITDTIMNTHVRDNLNFLYDGIGANYIKLDVGAAMHPISGLTSAGVSQVEIGTAAPIVNALVASFVGTADNWLQWQGHWPSSAGTSTPHAKGNFYMGTATSGTVVFGVQVAALSSGDSKTLKNFATTNLGTIAVPGTAGIITAFDITLTNNDSVTAGDSVIIGFYRETDDSADNAGGTAFFISGEIK